MDIKDVRVGMKVVPHSKTAYGYRQGLENSAVWRRAQQEGITDLYVSEIQPDRKPHPICFLSIGSSLVLGDCFAPSDFEPCAPTKKYPITPLKAGKDFPQEIKEALFKVFYAGFDLGDADNPVAYTPEDEVKIMFEEYFQKTYGGES